MGFGLVGINLQVCSIVLRIWTVVHIVPSLHTDWNWNFEYCFAVEAVLEV